MEYFLIKKFDTKIEFFYYASEFPKLFQKQCFAVKRFLMYLLETKNPYFYKLCWLIRPDGLHVIDAHDDLIKKVLYEDNVDHSLFQVRKNTSHFYSEHGDWFFKQKLVKSRLTENYDKELQEFLYEIDPSLIDFDKEYFKGKPNKFRMIFTKGVEF